MPLMRLFRQLAEGAVVMQANVGAMDQIFSRGDRRASCSDRPANVFFAKVTRGDAYARTAQRLRGSGERVAIPFGHERQVCASGSFRAMTCP